MAETEAVNEAYAAVDAAIRELVQVAWPAEQDDKPSTVVDWVIVVGSQYYDEDGDRAGMTSLLPRHGAQPSYITEGLLTSALHSQQNRD